MEQIFIISFNIDNWILSYSRTLTDGPFVGHITANTKIIMNGERVTVEEIQNIITSARAKVFLESDGENILRLEITTR